MLSLDEATVCKALIPRELQFYQTLPAVVKKFTPTFHGVISVRTVHDSDGYLRFLARPPPNYRLQPPAKARFVCLMDVETRAEKLSEKYLYY